MIDRLLRAVRLSVCGAGLSASLAYAAGLNAVDMPEALRGVNQATGTCKREDVAKGVITTGAKPLSSAKARGSCVITAPELQALKAEPGTVLVDVRSRRDEPLGGLGEVLAMPLAAVSTKTFLKPKTTVLVGDGRAERELHEVCDELMAKGFKRVKLLQGGVPSWRLAQTGTPGSTANERLTAADLWAESQFEANLVVLSPKQSALKQQFPSSLQAADVEPTGLKALVERWRKEHKQAFVSAMVLVLAPEENSAQIQRVREALQPLPVLVYADTGLAYARYQAEQKAVWAAHARGPRQPGCGL